MALILLIVLIAFIYNNNNKINELKEENKKLKQQLLKYKNFSENITTMESKDINNDIKENNKNFEERKFDSLKNEIKKEISEEEKKKIAIEKERKEREKKNTTILITGAVLIVLAVIVFLMSTWYTIPNILKTIVLAFLIGVFLQASKIAKQKFNLEKTSNTFFYIAMAYIPICLFSISLFGLFGEFFSLTGEGKYLYLTFSGIVTSIIYYITFKNRKNKFIFIGTLLSQVFTVILFSLIFSNEVELILLNLLLYNILFIILTIDQKDNCISDLKYIYSIIPYISTVILFSIFDNVNVIIPIIFVTLAVNYAILEEKEKKAIYAYLFNIVVSAFGVYCIGNAMTNIAENYIISQKVLNSAIYILNLIYCISVYVVENIILIGKEKKHLKNSLTITTLGILQLLFLEVLDFENIVLKPYIISLIQCIILFITYLKSKETGKKISSILIPITFIIAGLTLLADISANYHFYIIFALITFVIGELFDNARTRKIRKSNFLISNIFILLTYWGVLLIESSEFINDVIYFVILLCVYIYSYLKEKKYIFKYLSYVMLEITLISGCEFFKLSEDFMCLIPTMTLIGLINLEKNLKYLKDNCSNIFFAILKIISYIYLTILGGALGTISSIGLTAYLIYNNNKQNENTYLNIIPLIGVMPSIFGNELDSTLQLCIMILTTIGLTMLSTRNKKIGIYTIFSGIYLFFTLDELNEKYVSEILFIIWSLYNWYYMNKQKEKDIFKFLAYFGILNLYEIFAFELKLTQYTLFDMLGYIVFAILVIRDILSKYLKNIDAIEAIVFIFIYLSAISAYSNEADGMLFGALIVGIIFFSYVKKYGTLFLTSIAAILLNVFLLTREFWFSIPWWIYLLVIGSALISFAVRNEANEKNNKIDIASTLKRIKDKVEK